MAADCGLNLFIVSFHSSYAVWRSFNFVPTTKQNTFFHWPTSDAGVSRLQVRHQFLRTRERIVQRRIGHRDLAGAPARAAGVELAQDIGRTAQAAVVLSYAPTEPHATVSSLRDQHDLVRRRAAGVQGLPLAELEDARRTSRWTDSRDRSGGQR